MGRGGAGLSLGRGCLSLADREDGGTVEGGGGGVGRGARGGIRRRGPVVRRPGCCFVNCARNVYENERKEEGEGGSRRNFKPKEKS